MKAGAKSGPTHLAAGLLWTAPWWLGVLIFLALPMGFSLYISFCDYTLLQQPVCTGLRNYQQLAHDELFWKVLKNTFLFAGLSVPLTTLFAIILAVLMNEKVRGLAFFRACLFMPTVVPLVAAGVVWLWLLNPKFGLLSYVFHALGLAMPGLLDSPSWALGSLVLVSLWFVGSPMVIYLAGLQDIPEQLYEAAMLDGANSLRRFWHVTLPGLSPVILFNVIINIIGALQIFALPYVMFRGRPGPQEATYFYTSYLFDNAFRYLRMGYASAMAWIQLLIVLLLTALVFWASRKMVHYRGE